MSASKSSVTREVHFPSDRTIGRYSVVDEGYQFSPVGYKWIFGVDLTEAEQAAEPDTYHDGDAGEARGVVTVGPGMCLYLVLDASDEANFAALQTLNPDDVDVLDLTEQQIVPHHMTHLQHLSGLRKLIASDSSLTDDGLAVLPHLQQLEWIDLTCTRIADAGLPYVASVERLAVLRVGMTRITGEGLVHLAALPRLLALDLNMTAVTDETLPSLLPLQHLRVLRLDQTAVSDRVVDILRQFTGLEQLALRGTQVSDAGYASLERALPNCEIL